MMACSAACAQETQRVNKLPVMLENDKVYDLTGGKCLEVLLQPALGIKVYLVCSPGGKSISPLKQESHTSTMTHSRVKEL